MIKKEQVKNSLSGYFPHEPTSGQRELIDELSDFVATRSFEYKEAFVLTGYAGTGKTTLLSALVKSLKMLKGQVVLLAPTGRAAKVLGKYAGQKAFTIHKKIYRRMAGAGGFPQYLPSPNMHRDTIFIVDEASMIAAGYYTADKIFGMRDLLDDLLQYVYGGKGNRVILLGDRAQLPPVGMSLSPALDPDYLDGRYDTHFRYFELTQVVRQEMDSGILFNATDIRRQQVERPDQFPFIHTEEFSDVKRVSGYDLQDYLEDTYSRFGTEGVVVLCRSNKRANIFNQQVRNRVLWMEEELCAGDLIMVVKNNYFWVEDTSVAGFIANGDILEVLKIARTYEIYGMRFADLVVKMQDFPQMGELEVRVMLDTLHVEGPNLPREKMKEFYFEVMDDYADEKSEKKRKEKVVNDPFFNALQIKFAYALTCHKSQGGQWPAVFIDQGYLTEEMINLEYLRWLYTAFTRATKELYLVNFHPKFFGEKEGEE